MKTINTKLMLAAAISLIAIAPYANAEDTRTNAGIDTGTRNSAVQTSTHTNSDRIANTDGTTSKGINSASGTNTSNTKVNGGTNNTGAGANARWAEENAYWRTAYPKETYYNKTVKYDSYEPAYKYGYESYTQYEGKPYSQVEPQLESNWINARGATTLDWSQAKPAVQDAYERAQNGSSRM